MNRAMRMAITGVTAGMLAGGAAYLMKGSQGARMSRRMRHNTQKMLHTAGAVMGTVSEMMR